MKYDITEVMNFTPLGPWTLVDVVTREPIAEMHDCWFREVMLDRIKQAAMREVNEPTLIKEAA